MSENVQNVEAVEVENTSPVKKQIKKDKKKIVLNPYSIIVGIALIIYTISFVVPLLWGFMTSLKSFTQFKVDKVGLPNMQFWASDPYYKNNIFGNYLTAFKYMVDIPFKSQYIVGLFNKELIKASVEVGILECTINTFLYALGSSITFLIVTIFVGYLCAKYKYKFSNFVYGIVIFCMVMPLTNTQPAMIELLRKLRIFNTHPSMWLTGASFRSMYFLIFYGFFKDLPDTYNEAAEIDGASQFATMLRICIPLSAKMITTILLIQFVASWNNYSVPMIYLPTKPTLASFIYTLAGNNTGYATSGAFNWVPIKVACLMCLALPILILFVFLKDKLMGNISIGGIKE